MVTTNDDTLYADDDLCPVPVWKAGEGPAAACGLERACPQHDDPPGPGGGPTEGKVTGEVRDLLLADTPFPMADPVDPAEVEAEIDAWHAASEPQRRAERLEAGIVDAELVDEQGPECEVCGRPDLALVSPPRCSRHVIAYDPEDDCYIDARTGLPDPHRDRLRSIEMSSLAGRADSMDAGR